MKLLWTGDNSLYFSICERMCARYSIPLYQPFRKSIENNQKFLELASWKYVLCKMDLAIHLILKYLLNNIRNIGLDVAQRIKMIINLLYKAHIADIN